MFGSLRRKEGFSDLSRYKSVVSAMTGINLVKFESFKGLGKVISYHRVVFICNLSEMNKSNRVSVI